MAGKTMVISLPADWVKKYGIKKGEEIDVEEKGRNILISTKKGYELHKIRIDISDLDAQVIKWTLSAIQKSGYDEIEVIYNSKEQLNIIEGMIKDVMMGYEITEQSEKRCLIKVISQGLEAEFDNTLRRIFLVTLAMAEEGLIAIKKGNYDQLDEIIQKEITNNKLTNFCEMLINKSGFKDQKKVTFIYLIVWLLESVADDYRDMYKYLMTKKKFKLDKDILSIYEQTNKMLQMYYSVFYNPDNSKMVQVNKGCKDIAEKIYTTAKNRKPEEMTILIFFWGIAQKIRDFSTSTIALNL